jgi:hypothetical protein
MPQYREIPPNVRSELLEKVFSLVAYVDPTVSPHAFLLNPMMRTVLADELNSAMQSMVGWNKRPTLERLSRQARVTIDRLEDHAVVGLLMKDEVPLGYGEEALHEKGVESQVMRFYCPSASR